MILNADKTEMLEDLQEAINILTTAEADDILSEELAEPDFETEIADSSEVVTDVTPLNHDSAEVDDEEGWGAVEEEDWEDDENEDWGDVGDEDWSDDEPTENSTETPQTDVVEEQAVAQFTEDWEDDVSEETDKEESLETTNADDVEEGVNADIDVNAPKDTTLNADMGSETDTAQSTSTSNEVVKEDTVPVQSESPAQPTVHSENTQSTGVKNETVTQSKDTKVGSSSNNVNLNRTDEGVIFRDEMGLKEFLRLNKHMRRVEDVTRYFSGKEVNKAIQSGEIVMRKGKLIL